MKLTLEEEYEQLKMISLIHEAGNTKVTSLDVLKEINFFREKEKRGLLEHGDLLKIIRSEFKEELEELEEVPDGNISFGSKYIVKSTYIDKNNQNRPMFELTLNKAKQILLRESRTVRKAVIDKLDELVVVITNIHRNKMSKKEQLLAMKRFGNMLPEIESKESLPYIKINTSVNKAVSNYFGFPKMLKKDEMSQEMLLKREQVMERFLLAYELFNDFTMAKEFVYKEFAQVSIEQ